MEPLNRTNMEQVQTPTKDDLCPGNKLVLRNVTEAQSKDCKETNKDVRVSDGRKKGPEPDVSCQSPTFALTTEGSQYIDKQPEKNTPLPDREQEIRADIHLTCSQTKSHSVSSGQDFHAITEKPNGQKQSSVAHSYLIAVDTENTNNLMKSSSVKAYENMEMLDIEMSNSQMQGLTVELGLHAPGNTEDTQTQMQGYAIQLDSIASVAFEDTNAVTQDPAIETNHTALSDIDNTKAETQGCVVKIGPDATKDFKNIDAVTSDPAIESDRGALVNTNAETPGEVVEPGPDAPITIEETNAKAPGREVEPDMDAQMNIEKTYAKTPGRIEEPSQDPPVDNKENSAKTAARALEPGLYAPVDIEGTIARTLGRGEEPDLNALVDREKTNAKTQGRVVEPGLDAPVYIEETNAESHGRVEKLCPDAPADEKTNAKTPSRALETSLDVPVDIEENNAKISGLVKEPVRDAAVVIEDNNVKTLGRVKESGIHAPVDTDETNAKTPGRREDPGQDASVDVEESVAMVTCRAVEPGQNAKIGIDTTTGRTNRQSTQQTSTQPSHPNLSIDTNATSNPDPERGKVVTVVNTNRQPLQLSRANIVSVTRIIKLLNPECDVVTASEFWTSAMLFRQFLGNSAADNTLSASSEDIYDGNPKRCIYCRPNKRNAVFLPCCHCLCCLKCSDKLWQCPVCMQTVELRMAIAP